jgi:hypothetical protein
MFGLMNCRLNRAGRKRPRAAASEAARLSCQARASKACIVHGIEHSPGYSDSCGMCLYLRCVRGILHLDGPQLARINHEGFDESVQLGVRAAQRFRIHDDDWDRKAAASERGTP